MTTKTRARNAAMWVSVISQILLLLQLIGHISGLFDITEAMQNEILVGVDLVLGILATLGIISNPTKPDSKGYNL